MSRVDCDPGWAVFPRLTRLVEVGDRDGLVQFSHRTSELVAVAIAPAGVTAIVFSTKLILVWAGLIEAAQQAGLTVSFLLAGALMQSITAASYYIALAHGDVGSNLKVGITSVLLLVPLLISLAPETV